MEFDPEKARSNYRKHGVRFPDAEPVFHDPNALTIEDDAQGEQRFITLGLDALSRVLVIAYTMRGDIPRLISARKASPSEMRDYYHDQIA